MKVTTLGHPSKRTEFEYEGSVSQGVTILFTGKPKISSEFFKEILQNFKGKTVRGGFSMTSPTSGGFGEWIQDNSQRFGRKLTPRHGSFIAAILVNEGYIRSSLDGNAVVLHFPE